jgi:hypothetical protein
MLLRQFSKNYAFIINAIVCNSCIASIIYESYDMIGREVVIRNLETIVALAWQRGGWTAKDRKQERQTSKCEWIDDMGKWT